MKPSKDFKYQINRDYLINDSLLMVRRWLRHFHIDDKKLDFFIYFVEIILRLLVPVTRTKMPRTKVTRHYYEGLGIARNASSTLN